MSSRILGDFENWPENILDYLRLLKPDEPIESILNPQACVSQVSSMGKKVANLKDGKLELLTDKK